MSNLVVRTVSGIVFLAIMVAGILFHPVAFGLLFLVVMYMSLREFLHITMGERWLLQQKLALFTAAVIYLLCVGFCFYGLEAKWFAAALLPFLAIPVSVVCARNHDTVEDVAFIYLGLLYVCLALCLAPFMVSKGGEFSGYMLLNVFIVIWCSDVGAYSIGTLFGQKPDSRKLAPAISPKKSLWGLWGGIVTALLGAWVLHLVGWMPYPVLHCLAIGLVVSLAGVCGDLFESVWKRRYGFKDSGNCIPGHGGMLDRFDSSLFAIPAVFVYLVLTGLL